MKALSRITALLPARHWALLVFIIPLIASSFWRMHMQDTAPASLTEPSDPDPWVRLTLVRDFLLGGGWYSHLLSHSNAPYGGISSAWTRPLDVVIATLVYLHPGNAPLNLKLMHVASLLPTIWTALLLIGLFRSLRRYCDIPFAYFFAAGLSFAMIGARDYLGPGNADHHAPLTALWAWILSYLLAPNPTRGDMAITGALLGLMLWINPEALLLIAAIYAIFGLRWLHGASLRPLSTLSLAAAITSLLAVAIEYPPTQWFTPVYDSISIVHVYFLLLLTIAIHILALFAPRTLAHRLIAASISAAAIIALMYSIYPLFFAGPFALMHPYIVQTFLPKINEAKSLFRSPPLLQIAQLICPIVAILYLLLNLRRTETQLPPAATTTLLFLTLITTVLFIDHIRFFYYCYPPVLLAITIFFTSVFLPRDPALALYWPARAIAPIPESRQAVWRIGFILLIIAAPNALAYAQSQRTAASNKTNEQCEMQMRHWIHGGALQQALGPNPLILFAPTNLGGGLLFFTPYRIVASNYHRDGTAIQYIWDAPLIADAAAMHAYLAQRHIDALLICHDNDAPKNSFLNHLYDGTAQAPWLTRIPVSYTPTIAHDPQLWRVTPTTIN